MNRRDFLDLARYAALCATVPNEWRVRWSPRFVDDPFTLGVASGDPTPGGIMLWTRLAPRPLEPEGGMDTHRTVVNWEVAEDDAFAKVVQRGRATSAPELGYSVHADVTGLASDRWYFYRFMAGGATSPVGRTRTAPAPDASAPLRFSFVSCQHYETGLYTAYQHMAEEDFDLIVHLGDYIYENAPIEGRPRRHANPECITLDGYRVRYAQYKTDEHLRAAHAHCPWVVTWDDHEVDNNYAGLIGENDMESEEQMHARRAAAYQAYFEHQPIRVSRAKSWADLNITRAVDWGTLARFWVLDTRQWRSDQSCGDGTRVVPCGDWADPMRTLMGAPQEKWVTDGLAVNRARWQVIAQQVMMAPFDNLPGPEQRVNMDSWNGYPVARDRFLGSIATRAPNRTVVLSGDIHSNWVNELRSSFTRPGAPTVAAEFVGTSISSEGDGFEHRPDVTAQTLPENPHVLWHNARRGYVSCAVSPDEWRTDYRTVQYVSRPGAPIQTASSWRVKRGKPGIEKV
ncbi:MAG: alkaline phosphatase D family protein [Gemmatimonadales bacterium]